MPQVVPIIEVMMAFSAMAYEGQSIANARQKDMFANTVQPQVPSTDTAAANAQTTQTQERQTMLLSGGQTTLTGVGGAPTKSADVNRKKLLGGSDTTFSGLGGAAVLGGDVSPSHTLIGA